MGYIELVKMDESGVTVVPFEEWDIVTYSEIMNALAVNDVRDITR